MNKEDAMQIIERAKSKDPKALEIIFSNPKDEFFLHFIVVRARTDKGEIGERAREFVYKNQNFDKCWNCIVGMASDGSKYAFGIVLKNVDRFGSLKCIAEWASKDPRARKIVFEHFDDRNCWANIVSLAKEGYRDAIEIVLQNIGRDGAEPCIVDVVKKPGFFKDFLNKKNQNAISFARKHPEYLDSMEYFIDCARNGDEDADNLVLQNIRNANYQEKIVNLLIRGDDWAKGKLSQLAELGNRYAIKKILANPEKNEIAKSFAFKHPEYLESMGFIIETARKGDKDADDIVLRNIGNANYQEKIVNLSKEDDEWASRKLPRLAELGNRDAIEYIRAHPEKDGYWYYVVQEAKKGNSECLDMVFNHCAQNKECERFVLEMSEKGDVRASKKVIELAQNGNQVFQEAVYHNFPDNSMFRQIVIDKASSGVKFAEKMVLDTLKKGLSRIQGFDGLSYVLKLAKKNNREAKEIVFSKVVNHNRCRQFFWELANKGDADAIEYAALHYWGPQFIRQYENLNPHKKHNWKIAIGATVVLRNVQNGQKREYRIVTTEEDKPLEGKIRVDSPIGCSLINKRVGDRIDVWTPRVINYVTYEIEKVSY